MDIDVHYTYLSCYKPNIKYLSVEKFLTTLRNDTKCEYVMIKERNKSDACPVDTSKYRLFTLTDTSKQLSSDEQEELFSMLFATDRELIVFDDFSFGKYTLPKDLLNGKCTLEDLCTLELLPLFSSNLTFCNMVLCLDGKMTDDRFTEIKRLVGPKNICIYETLGQYHPSKTVIKYALMHNEWHIISKICPTKADLIWDSVKEIYKLSAINISRLNRCSFLNNYKL